MTKQIDIAEFQANLARYLKEAAGVDTLLICENRQPLAEVAAIKAEDTQEPV